MQNDERGIKMKDHVKFVQNIERCAKCEYSFCTSGRNDEHICSPIACLKDGKDCDNVMERMHR